MSQPLQETKGLAMAAVTDSGTAERPARLNSDALQMIVGILVIALTTFIPELAGNPYWSHTFQLVNLFIAVSILQNILLVDAGQASFGQGAIFGMAAYMVGIAFGTHEIGYAAAFLCGVLAALCGGLLFALPSLRVQGFHLGFVTLSAAIVFPEILVALNDWTNGINGISLSFSWLKEPGTLGVSPLSLMIAATGAAALILQVGLRRTVLGRRMVVAALSPEAAQSLGISPGLMRAVAFLIVAAGTGVAGALYPAVVGFVSPSAFKFDLSILFFFAIIVGGRGQPMGPIVGVWLLYLLPNILLAEFVHYRLLAYGFVTLLVVLMFPDGIVGWLEKLRVNRQRSRRDGPILHLDQLFSGREAANKEPGERSAIEVRQGYKAFGKVVALDRVDLTVREGEIHGLIGANGSGKTSLLNVLTGLSRINGGTVLVNGTDISGLPAHRISALGLGRTFQKPRIFPSLSIWGNVQIGLDGRGGDHTQPSALSIDTLRDELEGRSADWLPHGQRRLVEVMRVVLKEANILLLDEPAAGLSPDERREFANLLRNVSRRLGKTVVLVEHDLDLVWDVADRITVLDAGRVIATGTPTEVARNPAAQPLFVGSKHA
ncbi:ABC transporter permease subunit [Azospirillum soli]|uniref:branched-chain amino acid ABC transporter ATP-binding protein/permease n=1 Tax=Azospirillum soli TaxID=1304799 RepID=UPI001AE34403|nr:branched-chain amino acid ABC transporter ATP-binding protein/permease [Azospirillum soli]MBP2316852.1 branched-chain amino acid transport system permease protein [Azospirillum soli]